MYLVQQHKMYFTYNHTYVESPFMYNLGSTKIVNDWISFICSQYCDITGAIAQPQGNALKLICVRPTCIDDFGLSTIAVPLKTSQLGPIFLYRKTQSSFTLDRNTFKVGTMCPRGTKTTSSGSFTDQYQKTDFSVAQFTARF